MSNMVKIAEIGRYSTRRVTQFTPWFDVYIDENHHKGYATEGEAFAEFMRLVSDATKEET